MWKKRGSIRRRRPGLDALEDRYLLSGVDAPSSPPPPAVHLLRLVQAAPIGIDAPTVSPARLPFQALTDHAAAIGPDAMTGPVATPSPSPLAVTVHALASLSDGIAGLPIPPALPAWIGHARSSGPDPAPVPIASPAALAATDHTLAGLLDGITGGPTRTAWATLADLTAAGNPNPAEGPPSHREFLVQAERVLTSGPDAVAGLPPRVVFLDWAHHVDLSRLGVVPPPPHPENGRTDPNEFLSASQLETTAVHPGNDIDLVARVGRQEGEHCYDELTAQAATGRLMRGAYLLAVRSTFDERGAGVTPFDNSPDIVPGSVREPSSPRSLPRATRDPEPAGHHRGPGRDRDGERRRGRTAPGRRVDRRRPPLRSGLARASHRALLRRIRRPRLRAGRMAWPARADPGAVDVGGRDDGGGGLEALRRASDDAKAEHERGLEEPMVLPAFPELPGSWSMRA